MATRPKTRRVIPCRYKSAAAHRRPDFRRTRALNAECVQELARAGGAQAFDGAVRGAELNRTLASCMERGEASEALKGLPDRFDTFVRYCRRNAQWVAAQIDATKNKPREP